MSWLLHPLRTWRAVREFGRKLEQAQAEMCAGMHPGQTHEQAWGRDR